QFACRCAEPVYAQPAGELREPRPHRGVVSELVEVLVRTGEDFLEDVLRVRLGEPERLNGDRIHVAREPFDKLVPGLLVARPTACDELAIAEGRGHHADSDA